MFIIAVLLATKAPEPFAQQPGMVGDGTTGLAQDSATGLSAEAQKQCDLGRAAEGRALRLAHFRESEALAERAVTSDDQLASSA